MYDNNPFGKIMTSCLPLMRVLFMFNRTNKTILPEEEECCTFCKEPMHKSETCPIILQHITYQCSLIDDETLLRQYLSLLDTSVLQNYVDSHKLKEKMFLNCSKYYDRYIAPFETKQDEFNVELMVGYMHILPMYPEISVKRKRLALMQSAL